MKVEKITTVETDIEITEVTLLSIEEYWACRDRISDINSVPYVENCWWLRSPSLDRGHAAAILRGSLIISGNNEVGGEAYIRPALKIRLPEPSDLQIMDKFNLAEFKWTIISEDIALCDDYIGYTLFRRDYMAKDSNIYEVSDIKKWLDNWVKENGIELAI